MSEPADFDPQDDITRAADGLSALATAYASIGRDDEADELYHICAKLELRSPGLQACWGGPLNGQTGRRQILDDLIARYRPTCILETGTFRGLTTDWIAQRFDGPILTCEASKRYFFQAERNLSKHPHVAVTLSDSRRFLSALALTAPVGAKPLIYLDAHWEQDLPLKEELQIIMLKFESFIVMIDDFRVPGDDGYSWDDYGGEKALTIDYLATAGIEGCRLFFPALSSDDETGARRGCCVVSRNVPCAIEDGGLLRGGTLEHWRTVQNASVAPDAPSTVTPRHRHDAGSFDPEKASYPDQIIRLRQSLKSVQDQATATEAVIQDLKRTCDERQLVIEDLKSVQDQAIAKEAVIQDLKRTCDERQVVIDDLVRALDAERARP